MLAFLRRHLLLSNLVVSSQVPTVPDLLTVTSLVPMVCSNVVHMACSSVDLTVCSREAHMACSSQLLLMAQDQSPTEHLTVRLSMPQSTVVSHSMVVTHPCLGMAWFLPPLLSMLLPLLRMLLLLRSQVLSTAVLDNCLRQ